MVRGKKIRKDGFLSKISRVAIPASDPSPRKLMGSAERSVRACLRGGWNKVVKNVEGSQAQAQSPGESEGENVHGEAREERRVDEAGEGK